MATKTNNLKLSKAETTDAVRSTLTANNNNFDKLDDIITRLKANQISGTANGTEIEVADSANMESVLKVSGNSVQETRSGKNILDVTATPPFKYNVTKEVIETGVRITSTINGNSQDSFYVAYVVKKLTSSDVGKTVRLKSDCVSSSTNKSRFRIGVCASDGTNRTFLASSVAGGSGETLTAVIPELVEGQEYLCAVFSSTNGACNAGDYVDYTNVVLTINNEDMSYEPYGIMPSPEFESPIMSVKSKSDNLFDSDYSLVTKAEFVKQSDGSYYRATPKVYDGIWENTEGYTGQMSFTGECKWMNDVNGRGMVFEVYYTDGTKKDFMTNSGLWNRKWGSFELITEKGKVVQKISTSWGAGRESYFRNIMLNKGTTVLPYQPYGYVPVEARVEGKNKIDLYECVLKNEGQLSTSVTHSIINSNKITINSAGTWSRVACTVKGLKSNTTYTISALVDNPSGVNCGLYSKSADTLNVSTATKSNPKIIKSTNENGELYFEFYTNWSDTSVTSTITYDEIQVEEGSTVSNFTAPPKKVLVPLGDIELRSTPDGTRDTFVRVDGAWNVVANNTSTMFDGSNDEGWQLEGTQKFDDTLYLLSNGFIRQPFAVKNSLLYCDRFTQRSIYSVNQEGIMIEGGSSEWNLRIRVNKDRLATQDVSGFKTWLSANPMEVVWKPVTPTYTPITDQGLISALDELEQLILHKGYNRITVTGVNGAKAYLDLNYYKDINIVLDNINTKLGGV